MEATPRLSGERRGGRRDAFAIALVHPLERALDGRDDRLLAARLVVDHPGPPVARKPGQHLDRGRLVAEGSPRQLMDAIDAVDSKYNKA